MSITHQDFDEICRLVCPHCRNKVDLRQRPDTKEWVHDQWSRVTMTHTICWANGLRNSVYAERTDTDG